MPGQNERPRGTRHQRETQQQVLAASLRRRSNFIRLGIAGALTAAAVTGYAIINNNVGRSDTPPSASVTRIITPESSNGSESERTIRREVQRLSIQPNTTEQEKWRRGYQLSVDRISINDSTVEIAKIRLLSTLDLMDQSANPYFKHASDFLLTLMKTGEFSFNIHSTPDTRKPGIIISSDITATDDKLTYYTSIDADLILNRLGPVGLAAAITHEARHIEDLWNFQQTLDPSLTPEQRVQVDKQNQENDPQHLLRAEMRGYGVQSQAYIHQYGLLAGQRAETGSSLEEAATEFVRAGSDANSRAWRDYIQKVAID